MLLSISRCEHHFLKQSQSFHSMKILICEDQEILLTALQFRMRKVGYKAIIAKDGKEALATFDQEKIDLVVADLLMPRMTGLELIQQIRAKDEQVPIIVISPIDHEEEILNAFELGANDFVAKPFKPRELILRIKRLFQDQAIEKAEKQKAEQAAK